MHAVITSHRQDPTSRAVRPLLSVLVFSLSLAWPPASAPADTERETAARVGSPYFNHIGPPISDPLKYVNPRTGDRMIPVNINNAWGLINQRGRLIALPRFDWTDFDYDNRARAIRNGKTGYIRHNGDWVIAPRFALADRFQEGLAVVSDGQQVGFIEKDGNPLTQQTFDQALRFREGYAGVMRDGKAGFINRAGDVVIPLRFAGARSFHQKYAAVKETRGQDQPARAAYIDTRGKIAHRFGPEVTGLGDFHDNLAKVQVQTPAGKRWGYINRGFKGVIPPRFEDARDFVGGLAAVRSASRWGYIDRTGRWAIRPQYESADDFDETLALVRKDGQVGYIDKSGRMVLPPQFAFGEPQFNGLIRVRVAPSFAYLFITGRRLWDPAQADQGIKNLTNRERAAVGAIKGDELIAPRTFGPPQLRQQAPVPYQPDFMYDPVLPRPTGPNAPAL